MLLVDIALQNARSFPSKVRMALKPGLNVARLESEAQRALVVDCVYFPLFPDPSRSSATEHAVADPASPARAALSIYGRDKRAYRLLRDLGSGATRLYRFDPEPKKYVLLTEVTTEAAQYVRVQQQLPDEVSFERLFLITPDNRPSLGSRARSRSGTPIVAESPWGTGSFPSMSQVTGSGTGDMFSAPPRGGSMGGWVPGPGTPPFGMPGPGSGTFGSSMNMTNALVQSELEGGPVEPETMRREDLQRELHGLEQHISAARSVDEAQRELDALQRRRADLVQRAEILVRARAQAAELEEELAQQGDEIREVSPKLRERLETYDEARARYHADLARLEEDRAAAGLATETMDLVALDKDPYFIGGLAVALVALVAAFALDMGWIALFNLVGAAVAAGAAFRYVGELEERQRLEARGKQAEERRARIEKQYELETSMIRRSMEKLGIEDHRELARRLDAHLDLRQRAQEAQEAVQRAEADRAIVGAATELEAVNARIAELEPRVLGSAGSLESIEQMERRVRVLRRELAALGAEGAPSPRGRVPVIEGTADVSPPRTLHDDDDSDDGYDSGYAPAGRDSGDGSGSASGGPALLAAGGVGPGGIPGGSHGSGYGGGFGGGGADAGGLPPDRSRELMQAGADLVQMDVEDLARAFKGRLVQYLMALSDHRLSDCDFGPRGELSVQGKDGQERPYVQLGGEGLDLVDLGLRLALVEAIASKTRIPLIVDDPGRDFPPRRRKLFVQMLQHLSRRTQVVVLTDRDDIDGHPVEVEVV